MGLKVDDLAVGQWVAIEAELTDEHPLDSNPFWFASHRRESKVDGMPLRILAISLPFVCVTNGKYRFVLDAREVVFCRLCPKFVKTLTVTPRSYNGDRYVIHDDQQRSKLRPQEKSERACPVCSEKLIERYTAGVWILACRQCGFSGGCGANQ